MTKNIFTNHGLNAEDMAVVALAGMIFGDVRKMCEVLSILTSTVDVAYFVFTD